MRLAKSKELLANMPNPIKEIAYMMGFETYEYFFTVFKRKNGMTPSAYRQLTQGNSRIEACR